MTFSVQFLKQTFRQYLRELARDAICVVVEDVMREELDALIGVGWRECSPKRNGSGNGSYTGDLTSSFLEKPPWLAWRVMKQAIG